MNLKEGDYVLDVYPECKGEVGIIIKLLWNDKPISIKWLNTRKHYIPPYGEHITYNTYEQFDKSSSAYRFKIISKEKVMVELL
jgi:hypothetical protein